MERMRTLNVDEIDLVIGGLQTIDPVIVSHPPIIPLPPFPDLNSLQPTISIVYNYWDFGDVPIINYSAINQMVSGILDDIKKYVSPLIVNYPDGSDNDGDGYNETPPIVVTATRTQVSNAQFAYELALQDITNFQYFAAVGGPLLSLFGNKTGAIGGAILGGVSVNMQNSENDVVNALANAYYENLQSGRDITQAQYQAMY